MALDPKLFKYLCCPRPDHGPLTIKDMGSVICGKCGVSYQTLNGRFILIDDSRSMFSSAEIVALSDTRQFPMKTGWRHLLRQWLPASTSRTHGLDLLSKHVAQLPDAPVIVVIGCGFTGEELNRLFPSAQLILTDVTLQGDAMIACDGEWLPFQDESIDCVIIDQVLEHTVNPLAVVAEIHRCLKHNGLIYSGVPFHFPVHGYPFDFQRYTPLGHRLLFRRFEQVECAITQGPVSALSQTLIAMAVSLSQNLWWRRVTSGCVRLAIKPFLWLDWHISDMKRCSIPGNSALLVRKSGTEMMPLEIISTWTQMQQQKRST